MAPLIFFVGAQDNGFVCRADLFGVGRLVGGEGDLHFLRGGDGVRDFLRGGGGVRDFLGGGEGLGVGGDAAVPLKASSLPGAL